MRLVVRGRDAFRDVFEDRLCVELQRGEFAVPQYEAAIMKLRQLT